jgi:hypothetical protein
MDSARQLHERFLVVFDSRVHPKMMKIGEAMWNCRRTHPRQGMDESSPVRRDSVGALLRTRYLVSAGYERNEPFSLRRRPARSEAERNKEMLFERAEVFKTVNGVIFIYSGLPREKASPDRLKLN